MLAYAGLKIVLCLPPGKGFMAIRSMHSRQQISDSAIAGIVGGVSHVFLDSLMHRDMHPFWPIASGNAFAGMVSVGILHIMLAASGVFGIVLWLLTRDK